MPGWLDHEISVALLKAGRFLGALSAGPRASSWLCPCTRRQQEGLPRQSAVGLPPGAAGACCTVVRLHCLQ